MKRIAVLLVIIAAATTACGQGNVFALGVGDCFNDPESLSEVSDVEMVECSESHDNEVYATFDISGSDFPGEAAVQANAFDGCVAAFDAYVGSDYYVSSLAISALTPTSDSWNQGDHEVVCFLFDINGARLTTSAKGTGI